MSLKPVQATPESSDQIGLWNEILRKKKTKEEKEEEEQQQQEQERGRGG